MGNHVFICYAREDTDFVLKLAANLKSRGVPVWLDKWDINPGDDWDQVIDNAIYDCAKFLIVLSPSAVESREVRGELRTALDENKPITPVIYSACRIPRQLRMVQYVDFSNRNPDDETLLMQVVGTLRYSRAGGNPGGEQGETEGISKQIGRSEVESSVKNEEKKTIITPPSSFSEITNSIGMKFILIPAGEFFMGSENGGDNEKPVRKVIISKPFYLGKYPVTQAQWEAVMGKNPSRFKGDENRPVETVSWEGAQEFLQKLSIREKSGTYRLPTEAEWEYACRAGSTGAYCFGDNEPALKEYAWYTENSGGTTHPVGQLKPNAWGLYDMHGNVWEWVQDWYSKDYYQKRPNPDVDPQGPEEGESRVLRGGSFAFNQWSARCAFRSHFYLYLYNAAVNFGVRLVVLP